MVGTLMSRVGVACDPWNEVGQLQRAVNELLGDFAGATVDFPAVNVIANENECVVSADVPGIDPKDVNLTVSGNTLTLEGERKPEATQDNTIYHRRERDCGTFSRAIRLPYEVESTAVKANFSRGVLRIALPRKESTKPRRIDVLAE